MTRGDWLFLGLAAAAAILVRSRGGVVVLSRCLRLLGPWCCDWIPFRRASTSVAVQLGRGSRSCSRSLLAARSET